MLGSLDQFMPQLQEQQCFIKLSDYKSSHPTTSKKHSRRRDRSVLPTYTVQDKTHVLINFAKNHQEINSITEEIDHNKKENIQTQSRFYYEHGPFFVKPEITKDHIARENLKKKHNLLRAAAKVKQTQQESIQDRNPPSQHSFRHLSQQLNQANTPILKSSLHEKKSYDSHPKERKSIKACQKLIQFGYCLKWAKKHRKNGSYYQKMLHKDLNTPRTKTASHRQEYMRSISKILTHNEST